MQFTKMAGVNTSEKIWLNMFISSHEWHNDLSTKPAPSTVNYRGMVAHKVMDPSLYSSDNVPIGCKATVGLLDADDNRLAIGIVDTDMRVNHANIGPGKASLHDLEKRWVLVQTYGHCDRIWTDSNVTSSHHYLMASESASGQAIGVSKDTFNLHLALAGQFQLTVPVGGGTFIVDLSGTNTTGVAWDFAGGAFTKPIVARNRMRSGSLAGYPNIITTDVANQRPTPSCRFLGYHYLEDDAVVTGFTSTQSTPVDTWGTVTSVTRGWLMCMGIGINGA